MVQIAKGMVEKLESYVNGTIVPADEASISVYDRGFLMGDGVFDTWRTYDGACVDKVVSRHLERLSASLRYIELQPEALVEEVHTASLDLVQRNREAIQRIGDVWVNPIVTQGLGGSPSRIVLLLPLPVRPGVYTEGMRLIGTVTGYGPFGPVDPRVKSISRLGYARAEHRTDRIGPTTYGLLFNAQGFITEASGANILLVKDGVVITPPQWDVLPGVSMGIFRELASDLGYGTEERSLTMYDLLNADGAYLTGSSFAMAPVVSVDDIPLRRDEVVGPRVLDAWIKFVGFDFVRASQRIAAEHVAA